MLTELEQQVGGFKSSWCVCVCAGGGSSDYWSLVGSLPYGIKHLMLLKGCFLLTVFAHADGQAFVEAAGLTRAAVVFCYDAFIQ